MGSRNERRFCAVNYNKSAGFEVVHGLLDRLMQLLEVPYGKTGRTYHIREASGNLILPTLYMIYSISVRMNETVNLYLILWIDIFSCSKKCVSFAFEGRKLVSLNFRLN